MRDMEIMVRRKAMEKRIFRQKSSRRDCGEDRGVLRVE